MNKVNFFSFSSLDRKHYALCVRVYFSSVVFCQLDVYDGDRVYGRNFTFPFSSFVFSNCRWRVALPPLGRCPYSINTSLTHISKKKSLTSIRRQSSHTNREKKKKKKKNRAAASAANNNCISHHIHYSSFALFQILHLSSCVNIN